MFSSEIISWFCYLLGGKLAEYWLMKYRFDSLFLFFKKNFPTTTNPKRIGFRPKWSSIFFFFLNCFCCYFRNLAFNKCPHSPTLLSAGDCSEDTNPLWWHQIVAMETIAMSQIQCQHFANSQKRAREVVEVPNLTWKHALCKQVYETILER